MLYIKYSITPQGGADLNKNDKFIIIGGDNRQAHIADYLDGKGYDVAVYALPDAERFCSKSLKKEVENSKYIILPLPVTKDGRYIHTLTEAGISVDEIISLLTAEHVVFGGMLSKALESKIAKKAGGVYDYFRREDVTVKNTVPTVQGILKVIIDNVDYTINSSKCAVFGYGRVASLAADVLSSLGAEVTVCARKRSDLAKAEIKGYDTCFINEFCDIAKNYQIIINSVPSVVINNEILQRLKKGCLIIDVASAPYGVDFAAADKLGINAILCPSLPGKVAPVTAGRIIADGILNILEEEGYG